MCRRVAGDYSGAELVGTAVIWNNVARGENKQDKVVRDDCAVVSGEGAV